MPAKVGFVLIDRSLAPDMRPLSQPTGASCTQSKRLSNIFGALERSVKAIDSSFRSPGVPQEGLIATTKRSIALHRV
jgi:hypothetical protein